MLIRPVSNRMPSISWIYGSYVQNSSRKKSQNRFFKFYSAEKHPVWKRTFYFSFHVYHFFAFFVTALIECDIYASVLAECDWATNRIIDFTLIDDSDLRYINYILCKTISIQVDASNGDGVSSRDAIEMPTFSVNMDLSIMLLLSGLWPQKKSKYFVFFWLYEYYGMHRH